MKTTLALICLCGTISFTSCSQKSTNTSGSQLTSVETKDPNADYKPAFEGQTRVRAIETKTPYKFEVLTEKLDFPWGVKTLPDGRLLITEREGTFRIVDASGNVSEKIIKGVPEVNSKGQGGLLGVTIAPDFAQSRMIYWTFAEDISGGTVTSAAKGRVADDEKSIEGATVIYRAIPSYNGTLHYGGRILLDKDGSLYVSTGERSDKVTRPQAQETDSGLGKIVHITTNGEPIVDGPFAGKARPELFTYGHRNVQGLAVHPETGDLWSNEFGPRGGDEVNRIIAGKNYGWPTITYGIEYAGKQVGNAIQQKEGMEQPVYYWDPSVSPSGMTFYSGNAIPEWKDNLFIGTLSGLHIIRLDIKNNKVVGEERLLSDEIQRFRDITQGGEALYTVTDQGRLYRISKK
jgi:glucose/arabinose dehydrogenase